MTPDKLRERHAGKMLFKLKSRGANALRIARAERAYDAAHAKIKEDGDEG